MFCSEYYFFALKGPHLLVFDSGLEMYVEKSLMVLKLSKSKFVIENMTEPTKLNEKMFHIF